MSQISHLIAELAPAGVEFKALGEVLRIKNGKDHKALGDGDVPVYGSGGIMRYADTAAAAGPSVLIPRKGSLGNLFYVEGPFWVVDTIFRTEIDTSQVEPKFVYYKLLTMGLGEMNQAGGVPSQTQSVLNLLRIPVPPLAVQREIVRILDTFTRLEAELEAELEARRAQRVALTNNVAVALRDRQLEPGVLCRVTLGSIAQECIQPVKVHPGQKYVSLGVKWNGEGVIARESRDGDSIKATTLYRVSPGQLIYNRMFVVEGSFALVPDGCGGAVVSAEFPIFDLDVSRVEPEWLLQHLCDPHTLSQIEREVTGTERGSMKSRRRWKADQFREFEILLPSLDAQRETVRILRSSSALIRSLEDELASRRRQYEYYRDKLLTFEEAAG